MGRLIVINVSKKLMNPIKAHLKPKFKLKRVKVFVRKNNDNK